MKTCDCTKTVFCKECQQKISDCQMGMAFAMLKNPNSMVPDANGEWVRIGDIEGIK